MADQTNASVRQALLVHLERLYALARLLTTDADAAANLITATAERSWSEPLQDVSDRETRIWALKAVLHTHQQRTGWTLNVASIRAREKAYDGVATVEKERPLHSHQEELARMIIADRLPTVFASIPHDERVLLHLTDVEALEPDVIAQMLGKSDAVVENAVSIARSNLLNRLRADLRPSEQRLLHKHAPQGALREGLQQHVQSLFAPLPAGLRNSVVSATRSPQRVRDHEPAAQTSRDEHRQSDEVSPGRSRTILTWASRAIISIIILAFIGAAGFLAASWFDRSPETNLILLTAEHAAELEEVQIETDRLDEAERIVREELNLRVILPSIDQATLSGASITPLNADVTLPAFSYESEDGETITLYALSYRLLDQYAGRINLSRDVLRQIEDDTHFDLHDLGDQNVLVWRHRDVIYIAVTDGDATALRDRIIIPS